MIYLILQVTQIYYEMNFITSPSILSNDFPGTLRTIFTDCFWRTIFCSTKKMHVSEYVCKTCLKELDILLKWQGNLAGNFCSLQFLKKY